MYKKYKTSVAAFLIFSGLFLSKPSYADSVMINKEVAESSNFYEEVDGSVRPFGFIDQTDLYNLISEDDLYYKIEYKGKIGYVEKNHFYKLNHTALVNETDLRKDPDDDSEPMTSYKLMPDTKLTILEFVGVDDFVKVSYEQNRFNNEYINVRKKEDRDQLIRSLTGSDKTVPVETIANINMPDTVTVDDAIANSEEKIGYVHFKDLAISYRSQELIDKYVEYYRLLNASKTYVQTPVFDNGPIYDLGENQYFDATSHVENIEIHMTGSQTGIDLYSYACQFLGRPYVFGGEDLINGIDCSGFTMRVYQTIGIGLPHFAQSQQRYGLEIPFGQEQAGDLVFFGTSLYNITHVGIADGYGNMVHASSPRTGIIISPIRNPISIKRIIY